MSDGEGREECLPVLVSALVFEICSDTEFPNQGMQVLLIGGAKEIHRVYPMPLGLHHESNMIWHEAFEDMNTPLFPKDQAAAKKTSCEQVHML
jgi:hypothetical protein